MKKTLLTGLAAGLCLAFMIGTANAVPVQWNAGAGANGHWYDLVDSTLSWTDAEVAAESAGGYLATITSAEEQAFVSSLLTSYVAGDNLNVTSGYMIGGFQSDKSDEPGGNWQWVTPEVWNYEAWGGTGEPNNLYGYENYLYMDERYGWEWNDYNNVNSFYGMAPETERWVGFSGYIVESEPVPEPATMLLLGTGLAFVAVIRIRRRK